MTLSLPIIADVNRGSIARSVISVAERDYRHVLRSIAAQEVDAQVRIGNKPTNILVDGSASKPITAAERKVVVYFIDTQRMIAALRAVWDECLRLGARVTGASAREWRVWINDRDLGGNPSAVTARMLRQSDVVRVVGPEVAWTRKYRWLRGAGARMSYRRSRDVRRYGAIAKHRPKVRRGLHEQAALTVRRRFRGLLIYEAWVDVPNLNAGGRVDVSRIPTVSIALPGKGRLK